MDFQRSNRQVKDNIQYLSRRVLNSQLKCRYSKYLFSAMEMFLRY